MSAKSGPADGKQRDFSVVEHSALATVSTHVQTLVEKLASEAETTLDPALAAAYYNFCRTHHALRIEIGVGRYQHRTPAMALGVTDHPWSVQELITHPVYWNAGPAESRARFDSR